MTRAALAVLGCALAAPLAVPAVGAPASASGAAADRRAAAPAAAATDATGAPGSREDLRPQHSSDGVPGEIAPSRSALLRTRARSTEPVTWTVAPGVRVSKWTRIDGRGPVRAQLLTVRWDQPGVRLGYLNPSRVAATAKVGRMVRDAGALAGINGDFFDIGDTGAPLGVGKRGRRLLHAPRSGWNASFYVGGRGVPRIGEATLVARVPQRPHWIITNLNSPSIAPDGIGVYTSAWGRSPSRTVVGGRSVKARAVLVRQGRVVARYRKLPVGAPIRGKLLVGRGDGARKVWRTARGERIQLRGLGLTPGGTRTVLSGNKVLVRDGVIDVVDDREMHPRTAIGIDYDTREVLMLVIDGRSEASRGYTMVELANLMIELGADEALNLDGGGSSTMVAPSRTGTLRVINDPSDGGQRSVANGLGVFHRPSS